MGIRIFIIILLSFVGILNSSEITAQNYPQRTVEGKSFYVFTVEPGNTLYAISRQFAVEVDDLVRANPGVEKGLSIGQEIFVPVNAIDKKTLKNTDIRLEGTEIIHVVQKKETLFSISKVYGVKVNEIVALNPGSDTNLGNGQRLRIPIVKSTAIDSTFVQPARNDTFKIHQIQPGETLFAIAKSYGISVDSLQGQNPTIERGIKPEQWLVIPVYRDDYKPFVNPTRKDSLAALYESNEPVGTYKIGLMLPFELHMNDSLEYSLRTKKDLYILTEIALDYYRGTRLALDSLRKFGFNVKVYVYDVGEDAVDTQSLLKKPELKDLDVIFGPLHKASLALVSEFCRKNAIYMVSPNSFANEVFAENPYLFRASPSRETMMRYLANYVAIQHPADNVWMVNSKTQADWPYRKLFMQNYNSAVTTFPNTVSDSIRSFDISFLRGDGIHSVLKEGVKNVLVVPSNELAFVSDFMTRLSRVDEKKYDIQVYGLENWLKYDNIDASYKNRFHLRLVAPTYVEYGNEDVLQFLEQYRAKYDMEPTEFGYGFLGYDLMMYFGKELIQKGKSFPITIGELDMDGVCGGFRFGRSTTGSEFENKSVYIIEYKDYDISRIN